MLFLQRLLLFKQFSVQSKPAYATDSGANSAWGQTSHASQSRLHMFHKADTDQTSHASQSRHRSDFTCFTKQTQVRLHMLHKADTGQTSHASQSTDQTSHASQSRHRSDCTCFQCSERISRFVYKMQTHKRFRRKLFIWTKHNIHNVVFCLNKRLSFDLVCAWILI